MHRGPLAASLLAVVLAATLAWAAGPVDLNLRLAPSAPWKVRQTIVIQSGGAAALAAGTKTGGAATYDVQYVDKQTSDKGFKKNWVQRTYTAARVKLGAGKPEPVSLEGSVLNLEKPAEGEGTVVAAEKGKPSEHALEILKTGPWDPVQLLLPDHPVKAGDTWDLSPEHVELFHKLCSVGLDEVKNEAFKPILDAAQSLVSGGTRDLKISARVKSASATDATLEYSSGGDAGGRKDAAAPAAPVSVQGSLRFDVKNGRPVSLDWVVSSATPKPSGGGAAVGMTAGTAGGPSGKWTLNRKYDLGK